MTTLKTPDTAVEPLIPAAVELLLGDEAFALLSQEWFRTGWDALYRACPWATVFQSREFVTTWYRIFQQQYLPVLLWAGPPHHPTGLLTLALPISPAGTPTKGPLVGAGQYEAEYQTWLAEPAHGESFIQAALEQVQRRFPQHPIQFRFLPRGTPLGWLRRNPVWRKRGVLQPYNRPLMEMSHPDFPKLFRKTEFRNKLNRLKRLGELRFEHVTDLERFAGVLQGLTIQYDFRQGALFNKNQFRDNPEKAELLLALFDQNLLHVTLLLVNDEVIASIVAVNGQDWVHLGGINIHTPFFSNFSPGFVHFLLLGQQLAQEGVAVFDLTPGEDAYKKRYATSHDQVHELFIAGSLPYRLKKRLRKQVHSRLVKAGIRPMTVELALKKKIYLFKMSMQRIRQQGLLRPLLNRAKRLWAPPEQQIYVWQADSLPLPASNLLQQNNLADLLNFDAQGASLSRWEFLEDALRRFEQGERSYTWSENGLLLGCAWLGVPGQSRRNSLPRLQLPEGAVLLQGLYCHPAAKNRWQAFLAAVAGEAGQDKEPVGVYALAADKDPVLNQALVAAGFRAAAQPGK